jgi:hypothetical protein
LAELEQQRQKEEAARKELQIQAQHADLAEQYTEMVMRVLKDLRESMYPSSEVVRAGVGKWLIGYNYTSSYVEWGVRYINDSWHTDVQITLFGTNSKEGYFECKTEEYGAHDGSRSKKCYLTENELVTTLKQLHEKSFKSS